MEPLQPQLLFAVHSWSQVLLPHPCCAQGGTSPLAQRDPGLAISHRMWREISAVAASCHPQFHMSVFSLTFSNSTKNK